MARTSLFDNFADIEIRAVDGAERPEGRIGDWAADQAGSHSPNFERALLEGGTVAGAKDVQHGGNQPVRPRVGSCRASGRIILGRSAGRLLLGICYFTPRARLLAGPGSAGVCRCGALPEIYLRDTFCSLHFAFC
ncbi:MAG: hypothetical protein WBV90_18330, partial [Terrimicrobiaceae bacterium]